MPKFSVYGTFTATKYLGDFEADTQEQAIELALDSDTNHASLCHQCAREIDMDDYCAHEATAELNEESK